MLRIRRWQLRQYLTRNRAIAGAAAFLAVVMAMGAFIAFDLGVFASLHASSSQHGGIKFHDEALALATLLSTGLLIVLARVLVSQRQEVRRRIEAEQHARELAHQDVLTGLANRRQFDQKLIAAIASPPRAGGMHAVLILDLNGFKRVNDVYGHAAGDELLTKVAHCIVEAVRDVDLVARLGGDEFAVLGTHLIGPEDATNIALRIIRSLNAPIVAGGASHHIGVGIGVALFPQDGLTSEELLRRADIALYRAKAEGQSGLCFFEEEMDVAVRERDLLQRELQGAMRSGVIVPFYQPVVDLRTNEIIGFEALARWTHPTLGEVPPSRFIPIAEGGGLIGALTDQLLRRACEDALQWPPHISLSFNVSPVELKDRTLGLRVLSILGQTGLPPARLELELTESALVRDLAAAQDVLASLRAAGVRIALDDFGTGYSSLYHLRNFKIDRIKIDRSFIASMQIEPESAALVSALLGLGQGLGLSVTAEGIEEREQSAALLSAGCELGQGFLFGRAVSAEATLALLSHPYTATALKGSAG